MDYKKYGWRSYGLPVMCVAIVAFIFAAALGYIWAAITALLIATASGVLIPKAMREEMERMVRSRY